MKIYSLHLFLSLTLSSHLITKNYIVGKIIMRKKKKKKAAIPPPPPPPSPKNPKGKAANEFQFHNHLLTHGGVDLRKEKSAKSTSSIHRAVVPTTPLISRRFYDWPPNPSLSKVDVYSK